MTREVNVRELRQKTSECTQEVAQGKTLVVLWYGRPIATIRPAREQERGRRMGLVEFRRQLRWALTLAHRRPVLLTWYGAVFAVVEATPNGTLASIEEVAS